MKPVRVAPVAPEPFWRCGTCAVEHRNEDDARACCGGPRGDGLKWSMYGGALALVACMDLGERLGAIPLAACPARWPFVAGVAGFVLAGGNIGYRLSRKPRVKQEAWRSRIHTKRAGNIGLALFVPLAMAALALSCHPIFKGVERFAVMLAGILAAAFAGDFAHRRIDTATLRREPSLDRCGDSCTHPVIVARREATTPMEAR